MAVAGWIDHCGRTNCSLNLGLHREFPSPVGRLLRNLLQVRNPSMLSVTSFPAYSSSESRFGRRAHWPPASPPCGLFGAAVFTGAECAVGTMVVHRWMVIVRPSLDRRVTLRVIDPASLDAIGRTWTCRGHF